MLFDVFPSNFSHAMYGVSLRFYQQEFLHLSHVWSDILIFPRNSLSPSLVIHKERLCPEEQPWDNQDTYYLLTLETLWSAQGNFDMHESPEKLLGPHGTFVPPYYTIQNEIWFVD